MWIESHAGLERHPKLLELQRLSGWNKFEALGKLHCFWWWCTEYAEDGDLRKHGITKINTFLGLPETSEALQSAGFVDVKPYLRIHDWWDYFGRFLQVKYKNKPEKWLEIRVKLEGGSKGGSKNRSKRGSKPQDLTNQPTLTTKETSSLTNDEEEFLKLLKLHHKNAQPPAPANPKGLALEPSLKD